jgi:hypothetical protein
MKGLSTKL